MKDETVVGPLIDSSQVDRVLSWIGEAVQGGAELHCGGSADGSVVRPTSPTAVPRNPVTAGKGCDSPWRK
jgi:acyl-CoA reductase-like NAD-dependent aldehyde dehydrogenase